MKRNTLYIPAIMLLIITSGFVGWQGKTIYDKLETGVTKQSDSEVSHESWGDFYTYSPEATTETFGTKNMLTGVAVIEPGKQIHPPHQHSAEEFLFIVDGERTWSIEGKEFKAQKGEMMYAEPWDWHGITNTGDTPLTFFVVKWDNKGVELPKRKE